MRKLLFLILVAVMACCLTAFPAVAEVQEFSSGTAEDLLKAIKDAASDTELKLTGTPSGDLATQSAWIVNGNKKITLDLNGHHLTTKGSLWVGGGGTLTIKDSSKKEPVVENNTVTYDTAGGSITSTANFLFIVQNGELNVKGGKLATTDSTAAGAVINAQGNTGLDDNTTSSVVNVNGGYIAGDKYGVVVRGNGAKVDVTKGVIWGKEGSAISGNGTFNGSENQGRTVINISGGTLIGGDTAGGTSTIFGSAIYHPQKGNLNITGGTITAVNGTGLVIRSGTVDISGSPTITATGDGSTEGEVGDSPNKCTAGNVIFVDCAANYPGGVATVNIKGGTFTGSNVASFIHAQKTGETDAGISITGGTFKFKDATELNNYILSDHQAVKNEDNTLITVCPTTTPDADEVQLGALGTEYNVSKTKKLTVKYGTDTKWKVTSETETPVTIKPVVAGKSYKLSGNGLKVTLYKKVDNTDVLSTPVTLASSNPLTIDTSANSITTTGASVEVDGWTLTAESGPIKLTLNDDGTFKCTDKVLTITKGTTITSNTFKLAQNGTLTVSGGALTVTGATGTLNGWTLPAKLTVSDSDNSVTFTATDVNDSFSHGSTLTVEKKDTTHAALSITDIGDTVTVAGGTLKATGDKWTAENVKVTYGTTNGAHYKLESSDITANFALTLATSGGEITETLPVEIGYGGLVSVDTTAKNITFKTVTLDASSKLTGTPTTATIWDIKDVNLTLEGTITVKAGSVSQASSAVPVPIITVSDSNNDGIGKLITYTNNKYVVSATDTRACSHKRIDNNSEINERHENNIQFIVSGKNSTKSL